METYSFDGNYLLKDGKRCKCPHNPGILLPVTNSVINGNNMKLEVRYFDCNNTCPFMREAIRKQEDKPDLKGIAVLCMNTDRPIFYEISKK